MKNGSQIRFTGWHGHGEGRIEEKSAADLVQPKPRKLVRKLGV